MRGFSKIPNIGDSPNGSVPVDYSEEFPVPNTANPYRSLDEDGLDFPVKNGVLQENYDAVSTIEPKRAARVNAISMKAGVSPGYVDQNLSDVEKTVNGPSSEFLNRIENQYPGSTKYLSDPGNMAGIHDDLKNLVAHEDEVQKHSEAHGMIEAFQSGFQGSVLGLAKRGKLPDMSLPENADLLDTFASAIGDFTGNIPAYWAGGQLGTAAGAPAGAIIGSALFPGLGTLAGAAVGGATGGTAGAFAYAGALKQALIDKFKNGDIKDFNDLVTRTQEISNEAIKQGVIGVATGGANVGTASLLSKYAVPSIVNSIAPVVAEVTAMTGAASAVEGEVPTGKQLLENAVTVAGLHGLGKVAEATSTKIQKARLQADGNFYDVMGTLSKEAKLNERVPEQYVAHVGELVKGTKAEKIYVPIEKLNEYFQGKNIDPAKAMESVGAGDSYRESLQTGGDVEVPFEKWVGEFGGKEYYQDLKNDVKFSKEGLTKNEEAEINKEVQNTTETQAAQPEPQLSISEDVAQKAEVAGRTKAEAESIGKLHESYFGRLGQILGMDPSDLYQKYNLQITQGGSEPTSVIGKELSQEKRGGIVFGDNNEATIRLLKKADKSTLLHESAHLFLEAHRDALSILGQATEHTPEQAQFLKDSDALKKFLGVDTFDNLPDEKHELFARSWEQYLRTGEAPSADLKSVFRKFSQWLKKIYANAVSLNVELSPDVKEVFNRMLVSDVQIQQVNAETGADIQAVESKPIAQMREEARNVAEEKLLREQLKETTKEHKEFLASEKDRLEKKAEVDARNHPVFQAMDYIKERVSKSDIAKMANALLDGKLKFNDQVVFESAAELHNFIDGRDLAEQILIADKNNFLELEKKRIVDEGMLEHAGLLDPEALHDAALDTVHTARAAELVALEGQILDGMIKKDPSVKKEISERRRAEAKAEVKAAKESAQDILSKKSTKDASNFRQFVTQERRAAERAAKFAEQGDLESAREAKREQLVNHELATESMRLRKEIEKKTKYLDKLSKRGNDFLNMSYGFARQIDRMLTLSGFSNRPLENPAEMQKIADSMMASGESAYEIADRTGQILGSDGTWQQENLSQFASRMKDNFYPMDIPQNIQSMGEIDYRNMSVADFNDLHDTVKNISFLGRVQDKFLTLFNHASVKEAAIKASNFIREKIGTPFADQTKIGKKYEAEWRNKIDVISGLPDGLITANLVNLLTLSEYLDRKDPTGPMKEFVYRVLKNAEDKELVAIEKAKEQLKEILDKHFESGEFGKLASEKIRVGADGRYINRQELIYLVMNLGTETGRDRISRGYSLGPEEIQSLVNRLSKKEVDYVQAIWDHLDTYWPKAKELEMRVNGLEPEKSEPSELVTPHGVYRGGYYPLDYDNAKSIDAYKNSLERTALGKEYNSARASTHQGFLKSRVDTLKRPVKLSLNVLTDHLADVLHDIHGREAVIDVNKFLSQKEVRQSIIEAVGLNGVKAIDSAVNAFAGGETDTLTDLDRAANKVRFGVTFAKLGFRLAQYAIDLSGNAATVMSEIGPRKTLQGIINYAKEGVRSTFAGESNKIAKFVHEKSIRMKNRAEMKERDFKEIAKYWEGSESNIKKFAFFAQVAADEHVSLPLWVEVYKNAISKYDERTAINLADETITKAIGSGSVLDLAQIQRGSGVKKLMTMYYSWSGMMFNRMWLDGKLAGLEKNEGNYLKALQISAKSLLFGWGLQSLNENLWKEFFRNTQGDEDEDKKLKRVVARTLQQPLSYVPVLRDFTEAGLNYYQFGKVQFSASPAEQAVEEVLKGLIAVPKFLGSDDTQNSLKQAESAAKVLPYALGYGQRINDIAFNFLDYMNDNGDANFRDILTRRVKK